MTVTHHLNTDKKEAEEEEGEAVKKKGITSGTCKLAVPDLEQHYPVKVSAPHNECPALTYTNRIKAHFCSLDIQKQIRMF